MPQLPAPDRVVPLCAGGRGRRGQGVLAHGSECVDGRVYGRRVDVNLGVSGKDTGWCRLGRRELGKRRLMKNTNTLPYRVLPSLLQSPSTRLCNDSEAASHETTGTFPGRAASSPNPGLSVLPPHLPHRAVPGGIPTCTPSHSFSLPHLHVSFVFCMS